MFVFQVVDGNARRGKVALGTHQRIRARSVQVDHFHAGVGSLHAHDKRDIGIARKDVLIALLGGVFGKMQRVPADGKVLVNLRWDSREEVDAHRDVQRGISVFDAREHGFHLVDLEQALPRLVNGLQPFRRGDHHIALTLEDVDAELAFDRFDGMGNVLPAREACLGRLGIARGICRRDQVAQLLDFHVSPASHP